MFYGPNLILKDDIILRACKCLLSGHQVTNVSSTPRLLHKSGSIQITGADQWINFTVGSNPVPLCSGT